MSTDEAGTQTTTNKTSVDPDDNNDNMHDIKDTTPTDPDLNYNNGDTNNIDSTTDPPETRIVTMNSTSDTSMNNTNDPEPTYMLKSEDRSFSLKRMATKAMIYNIPEDVEHTKLKDGFQCGYITIWIIAICLSMLVVIVDWSIVITFRVHKCNIPNNYNHDELNVEFGSFNSFGQLIQQIWLTTICLGGFGLYYLPELIGITENENDGNTLRNARWTVFILPLSTQILVNLILVPISYNFRSLFNAVTLLLFLPWAYYYKKCDGVRALYPLFATIFMTVILYYTVSVILFSNMPLSLYALTYPLYLSFAQAVLLKCLEYLDLCKCCKRNISDDDYPTNDTNKNMEEAMQEETKISDKSCMDKMWAMEQRWRDKSPVNKWTKSYIYFMCAMIVVMAESFRIASYIILAKESITDLCISLITSVLTECIGRNLILKIIYDKYIMKRETSAPISNVKSIFLGCKYHTGIDNIKVYVFMNIYCVN